MPTINQVEMVPYAAAQMFELVNAVELYPEFLPWCERAEVAIRTPSLIRARLDVRKGRLHYRFTTDNHLRAFEQIDMRLVDGPFKQLQGTWRFIDNALGSRVSLNLDFEFANRIVGAAIGPLFKVMTSSLVARFKQRAEILYGR